MFLEEPWVTTEDSRECRNARRSFYRSLFGAESENMRAAKLLMKDCLLDEPGLWGWSPETYRGVVSSMLAAEGLQLIGVAGHSFGAPRVAQVWDNSSIEFAFLSNPAPRSLSLEEYLVRRAKSIYRVIADVCSSCRGDLDAARTFLDEAAQMLDAHPVLLDTRSVPVRGADVYAAAISLAYRDLEGRREIISAIASLGRAASAEVIGRASDEVLLRYGKQDVQPGFLAYLQEICSTYPATEESAIAGDAGLLGLMLRIHAPCAVLAMSPNSIAELDTSVEYCVAAATSDAVAPNGFRDWVRLRSDARVILNGDRDHGSPTGLFECRSN